MFQTIAAVLFGVVLDLLIGDPVFLYHPVRLIGHAITSAEQALRRIFPATKGGERAAGALLAIVIAAGSTLIPAAILYLLNRVHWLAGFAVQVFWCYQLLATRSLKEESMKVYRALEHGTLNEARQAVAMIVGRDTEKLDKEGVAKATVETIAENASDGVIAPLIFMMIGGPVFGFLYKSVNTMDSMVGYKNEKYMYFGTAAARLDDVLNFIPARLCALFMIVSAAVCGLDARSAAAVFKRDRKNHASPNSAQTESVMAGALHVQLAGDAWYFGKLYHKKTIGNADRPVTPQDIVRANRMMYLTCGLAAVVFALVRAAAVTAFMH
ncbi:MAG: cobalamin biosynthesis protein CobD [Eubacterium sp.]|nr:cobalamin biosynthesis protein CobD [Eubacterium sp.]